MVKMKSSLRRLYGRHHDLVYRYGMSVLQITMDMFRLSYHNHNHFLLIFINNHRIFNKSNTMGATSGAGTAYLFRIFCGVRVAQWLVFCVMFCSFIVCVFYCLYFYILLLITPLVSSHFS